MPPPRPDATDHGRRGEVAPTDGDLVRRLLRGDAAAWTVFVDREGPGIAGMARRMLRRRGGRASDVDVDEIVAETFLLLVRDDRRLLRAYDEAWPLRTWLSVLVRTAVGRQARRKRPVPRADLAPVDRERDPEQGARAREMETAVRRALARLGDRDRLLLRLRVVARLDYVGIAEALGIEASSVGPLVTRAKARLRAFLAEDPGGPAA